MKKISSAFTLIELLVVISIIGVLATLLSANYNAARGRARDATRKSDLRNIQTAIRSYYNDHGRNPCDSGSPNYEIKGCGSQAACASVTACQWGGPFAEGSQSYMTVLPNDPQAPDRAYRYDLEADTEVYTIKACLENGNDVDCSSTQEAWCNTQLAGCLYIVKP